MSLHSDMALPVRVIDLFSGVSGFGLGAEWAGAEVVASFDKDPDLTSTHHLNRPNCDLHLTDLASIRPDEFGTWINRKYGNLDGVIGGPPCQGFSEIGRRAPDDIRNALLIKYAEIVAAVTPKFFVLENVPGLLFPAARDLLERVQKILSENYILSTPTTLSAQDFGVPTTRKRVFIGGIHKSLCVAPDLECLSDVSRRRPVTVRQAITDLSSPLNMTWREHPAPVWLGYRLHGSSVSRYAQLMRQAPPHEIGCAETASQIHARRVSGCRGTRHTPAVRRRLRNLRGGEVDSISKCQRLSWDRLCPTLRAGTGPERGSYQAIRPIHPHEPRVITVREAARLQGFPDWYQFHATNWHAFRMIGNSIPPLLAKSVIRQLIDGLAAGGMINPVSNDGRQQIA